MDELAAIIRAKIQTKGAVSFAWFMEQALFHPVFGYYAAERQRIGRKGDYITNVSVSATYGQILALQLAEMWEILERPADFAIIEFGAEDGQLAEDILSGLRAGPLSRRAHYYVVEPIISKQRHQRARLEPGFPGQVTWVKDITPLKDLAGAVIANELIDAMPVHLVEHRNGCWSELLVRNSEHGFAFFSSVPTLPDLSEVCYRLSVPADRPYRTEVRLAAGPWIESMAQKLKQGFVLLADYGYSRTEYYQPERTQGTLACYHRHRRLLDPLQRPGDYDITAHVDFTSLAEAAERADLHLAGYTDQHHFLVGAAESKLRRLEQEVISQGLTQEHTRFLRGYRTLMHPGTMGMAFKFILFTKAVRPPWDLSGFRYAADPRKRLGLSQ